MKLPVPAILGVLIFSITVTGCSVAHDRTAYVAQAGSRERISDTWPEDEIANMQEVFRVVADQHGLNDRERASNLSILAEFKWSITAYSKYEGIATPGNVTLIATGNRKRVGPIRILLRHTIGFFWETDREKQVCEPIWEDLIERLKTNFGDRIVED